MTAKTNKLPSSTPERTPERPYADVGWCFAHGVRAAKLWAIDLCRATNASVDEIRAWSNGQTKPSPEQRSALRKLLGVDYWENTEDVSAVMPAFPYKAGGQALGVVILKHGYVESLESDFDVFDAAIAMGVPRRDLLPWLLGETMPSPDWRAHLRSLFGVDYWENAE